MRYTITAIRRQELPKKAGGTWTKIEIKTDKTGDEVFELGRGINYKDKVQVGDVVNGYTEKKPWTASDGTTRYNNILNGVTVEYLYEYLLKTQPELANFVPAPVAAASPQASFQTAATPGFQAPAAPEVPSIEYPADEINPEDIPF